MQGSKAAPHLLLRATAFVLHLLSAVFLAYTTVRCGAAFVTNTYAEAAGRERSGYEVLLRRPCQGRGCFYATPQTFEVAQTGLEWNVFALLTAFEWISAGFALWHLDPTGATRPLVYAWNLAGALFLMPYTTHLTTMQTGLSALSLLAATVAQMYPVDPSHSTVAMHYAEYCTSASLLFLAVLILFVQDPPSWACVVGFTGVLLCNLMGVDAHLTKMEEPRGGVPLSPPLPESSAFDFNWAGVGNQFKLFLIHSWLALLLALSVILYLSGSALGDPAVPLWVRLLLYNLLLTYSLFGIWATACYITAGYSADPDAWTGRILGSGLTVLSALAKLPVVYTVFYGLLLQPGHPLCTL